MTRRFATLVMRKGLVSNELLDEGEATSLARWYGAVHGQRNELAL